MLLAHPAYLKPFAKKRAKTDKVDAWVLAQLLRMDYLPESYVPGKEMRDQRVMIRHHASLVRLRTSIKNRVYVLLAIEGIQTSEFSDLFEKRGMETARHLAESVYWVLTRKEYYKENRAIRVSSFS